LVIPARPDPRRVVPRSSDERYIEGQRLIVEAIRHLVRQDAAEDRDAISMLSEHFRTQFRMSDRPKN
jgi:hypothetical protein